MPSKEHHGSSIVSLRLPDTLLERLERYLDWLETHRREHSSRNHVLRHALAMWLEQQEQQLGMARPDLSRQHFREAYNALRGEPHGVRISRLRQYLDWSVDHFDAVLEQLRAEEQVELSSGVPAALTAQERRDSYQVNGQLYLSLACLKTSRSLCRGNGRDGSARKIESLKGL
jgi:hypothetical protein